MVLLDPHVIRLHAIVTPLKNTLFEIKMVKMKTRDVKVVPAQVLMAFFFEAQPNNSKFPGGGLRIGTSTSDSDSDSSTPNVAGAKRRRRSKYHAKEADSTAMEQDEFSGLNCCWNGNGEK